MAKTPKFKLNATPNQLANLQTFGKISPELQHERSVAGGKARAAQMAKERTFKEAAKWLMTLPAFATDNEAVNALKEQFKDLDNAEAMTIAVMKKAIDDGDPKAYTTIRDTIGELPCQTVNVASAEPMTINIKTIV